MGLISTTDSIALLIVVYLEGIVTDQIPKDGGVKVFTPVS